MPATRTAPTLARLPEAALELDACGTVLAANDLAGAMFGAAPAELCGRPVEELVDLAPVLQEALARRADAPARAKLVGRRANSTPFPLEASLRTVGAASLCLLREPERADLAGEAQRFFDVAFDTAPIGMALFNPDGEYVRVNPALCAMLAREPEDLLGRRDQELTHPEDRQADLDAVWEILEGRGSTHQTEKRFLRPDGSIVWAIANLTFLRDELGRPLSWVGQFQDITARRASEDALRHERDLSAAILASMGEGFTLTRDGRIVAVNDALCRLTGFAREELVGASVPYPFLPPELHDEAGAARERLLAEGSGDLEVTLVRKDGQRFHAAITSARADAPDGAHLGLVTTIRDVSVQKRHEEKLTRQASSDALTGLLNRTAFLARLHAEVDGARLAGRPLALALLDLDHFKAVNDTHGHPAGDRVLVEAARVLRAIGRAGDDVARVGGEEFAWLLPGSDAGAALIAAERARAAFERADLAPPTPAGRLTISIGLCELADARDVDDLYRLADVALYAAKAAGRNRCVCHTPGPPAP